MSGRNWQHRKLGITATVHAHWHAGEGERTDSSLHARWYVTKSVFQVLELEVPRNDKQLQMEAIIPSTYVHAP
jgi:hypothetical protein